MAHNLSIYYIMNKHIDDYNNNIEQPILNNVLDIIEKIEEDDIYLIAYFTKEIEKNINLKESTIINLLNAYVNITKLWFSIIKLAINPKAKCGISFMYLVETQEIPNVDHSWIDTIILGNVNTFISRQKYFYNGLIGARNYVHLYKPGDNLEMFNDFKVNLKSKEKLSIIEILNRFQEPYIYFGLYSENKRIIQRKIIISEFDSRQPYEIMYNKSDEYVNQYLDETLNPAVIIFDKYVVKLNKICYMFGGKSRIRRRCLSKRKYFVRRHAKHRSNVTRKMFGGQSIEKDDILYEDSLVRILRPEVKKGIIVKTTFNQPIGKNNLCDYGLKTGKQLQKDGILFGRSVYHPYIFFRAPYFSREIDYSTRESEIISLFGQVEESNAYIRVDPDYTYVYSSDIRTHYKPINIPYTDEWVDEMKKEVNKSEKTLTRYLGIIEENTKLSKTSNEIFVYDLYSSLKTTIERPVTNYDVSIKKSKNSKTVKIKHKEIKLNSGKDKTPYPLSKNKIEENSEILVAIPSFGPEYFVYCSSRH